MLERFTDRARKAMALANQEAQKSNHEYISDGHILLGLVKEASGIAGHVLASFGVSLCSAREAMKQIEKSGPEMLTMGRLPQTPRAKKVVEYAMEECQRLQHNFLGTEHLLLGVLRDSEGISGRILIALGVDANAVRNRCLELIGVEPPAEIHQKIALLALSPAEYKTLCDLARILPSVMSRDVTWVDCPVDGVKP